MSGTIRGMNGRSGLVLFVTLAAVFLAVAATGQEPFLWIGLGMLVVAGLIWLRRRRRSG